MTPYAQARKANEESDTIPIGGPIFEPWEYSAAHCFTPTEGPAKGRIGIVSTEMEFVKPVWEMNCE